MKRITRIPSEILICNSDTSEQRAAGVSQAQSAKHNTVLRLCYPIVLQIPDCPPRSLLMSWNAPQLCSVKFGNISSWEKELWGFHCRIMLMLSGATNKSKCINYIIFGYERWHSLCVRSITRRACCVMWDGLTTNSTETVSLILPHSFDFTHIWCRVHAQSCLQPCFQQQQETKFRKLMCADALLVVHGQELPREGPEKIMFWLKISQTRLENVPPCRYKYPVVSCLRMVKHHLERWLLARLPSAVTPPPSPRLSDTNVSSYTHYEDAIWHKYKHFTGLFLAVVGGDQTGAKRRVYKEVLDSSDGHENNSKQEEMFELTEPY